MFREKSLKMVIFLVLALVSLFFMSGAQGTEDTYNSVFKDQNLRNQIIVLLNVKGEDKIDEAMLEQIKKIELTDVKVTTLEGIGRLSNLEKLKITNGSIEIIPEEISNLKKLISLDLSHNKIRFLPEGLSSLSSLKELNIEYNNLEIPLEALGPEVLIKNSNQKGKPLSSTFYLDDPIEMDSLMNQLFLSLKEKSGGSVKDIGHWELVNSKGVKMLSLSPDGKEFGTSFINKEDTYSLSFIVENGDASNLDGTIFNSVIRIVSYAKIEGIITNIWTEDPLENVLVELKDYEGKSYGQYLTDKQGKYKFGGIKGNYYEISVIKEGYSDGLDYIVLNEGTNLREDFSLVPKDVGPQLLKKTTLPTTGKSERVLVGVLSLVLGLSILLRFKNKGQEE